MLLTQVKRNLLRTFDEVAFDYRLTVKIASRGADV